MTNKGSIKSSEELMAVLEAYSEATERLQKSHGKLHEQVASLSAELEQKNKLLERKTRLEVLGEMAAGVAHEIRNPLGGILLYAGLLERDLAGSPEALRLIRSIMSGVRSLNTTVADLLSFTRGFEATIHVCSLSRVIESTLTDAIGELARTDVVVNREYANPDIEVMVDPELLRRAILNLVLNAIQAMGKRGTLSMRNGMTGDVEEGAWWIEVSDTGPGVNSEIMDRLFEPYVTDKPGGTGLGLAIVQKIAESHGGMASVSNLGDGGACFRLEFPSGGRRMVTTGSKQTTTR